MESVKSFLEANHWEMRSDRLTQTFPLSEFRFSLKHRAEQIGQILLQWYSRFEAMSTNPNKRGDKVNCPHIVIPAAPGLGKSRLLQVMATPIRNGSEDALVKKEVSRRTRGYRRALNFLNF